MVFRWRMYTGMADKLYFQIFYGQGEICYGLEGVDLSGFKSVTKGIARASERTFGGSIQLVTTVF